MINERDTCNNSKISWLCLQSHNVPCHVRIRNAISAIFGMHMRYTFDSECPLAFFSSSTWLTEIFGNTMTWKTLLLKKLTNWPKIGQSQMSIEYFQNISSGLSIHIYAESDALLNDTYLAWTNIHLTKLSSNM
jgi:hypothetical protein